MLNCIAFVTNTQFEVASRRPAVGHKMVAHFFSAQQPLGMVQRQLPAQAHRFQAAMRPPAVRRRALVAVAAQGGQAAPPVSLTLPSGTSVAMAQPALVIGSANDADMQLKGSNIAAQHARLEYKGGRLFCTALGGDPDLLLAPTHCWLDGTELRPGVSYMVAPGSTLAFGTADNSLTCSFQEGGSSAMTEMLMKGLAAGASKEVQDKLGGL